MEKKSRKLPRKAVQSAANGVFFMTFFGALWASIGIVGSNGFGSTWFVIISGLITLILLFNAFQLLGKSRQLSNEVKPEEQTHWKKVGKWFGIVFGLEGVTIAIASVICSKTDHFELFFPIMAILVGVHFFPLAQLFQVKIHYITGSVLCILGIIAFFIPLQANLAGISLVPRSMFIGYSTAIALWLTGFSICVSTSRKIR